MRSNKFTLLADNINTSSDINPIDTLPSELLEAKVSPFLNDKDLSNLASVIKEYRGKLKPDLVIRKNQPFIRELQLLKTKGYKSDCEYMQKQLDEIIKNITKTGELYNPENTKILSRSKTFFYDNKPYEISKWLYADAMMKKKDYPHLALFIMNSLNNYADYLETLDKARAWLEFAGDMPLKEFFFQWERMVGLYYFLEKYKNCSSKIKRDQWIGLDTLGSEQPMLDLAFSELNLLYGSSEEKTSIANTNEEYINACLRVYTVLLHQQHYSSLGSSYDIMRRSLWRNVDLYDFHIAKLQAIEKGTEASFKKVIVIDRLHAGILASLLIFHYLENSFSAHKNEVSLIVAKLIEIREGTLATKNLELFKDELVGIAKTDERLFLLLKEWDTPSIELLGRLKKDYALNLTFDGVKERNVIKNRIFYHVTFDGTLQKNMTVTDDKIYISEPNSSLSDSKMLDLPTSSEKELKNSGKVLNSSPSINNHSSNSSSSSSQGYALSSNSFISQWSSSQQTSDVVSSQTTLQEVVAPRV